MAGRLRCLRNQVKKISCISETYSPPHRLDALDEISNHGTFISLNVLSPLRDGAAHKLAKVDFSRLLESP